MVVPAVPELTEKALHESVDARMDQLASLRELGPPDLVHLLRQVIRNPQKQAGIYHYVTGVDASSSASLAAYINTLVYRDQGPQATTKIVEGIYCCYNAFSRVDMRVHVRIPGSVDAYSVDERGEKGKATDELWLETYLCSVLRAYSYADDGSGDNVQRIMGMRRFNPITSQDTEERFLTTAEQLFFRGWQLGSDSLVQVPNPVSNHLTAGLLKYFQTTGRYASGIKLFDRLRTSSPNVSSLLARLLFMGNEEVEGVRVLYHALKELPMDYVMLDTQAEFLIRKAQASTTPSQREERLRMALECADRSTIAAPSEFGTWARLAQIYIQLEDWENALTILNSCPMFTYQDKDSPLALETKDTFLPTLAETRLDEIDSEPEGRYHEQVDASLLNLRASQYRGTFKAAYHILTEMTAKIGWDQLLKIRSTVFVMEEEYRSEKHDGAGGGGGGGGAGGGGDAAVKRSPSIDVLRGTPDATTNGGDDDDRDGHEDGHDGHGHDRHDGHVGLDGHDGQDGHEEGHSTAQSSEESRGDKAEEAETEIETSAEAVAKAENSADLNGAVPDRKVERPVQAIDPATVRTDTSTPAPADQVLSRLNNKRLCERWLDALFMVLYEDLRVYTIWRTQMAQYRAQQIQYRKSAEEWEILGSLAERLQHSDEAVEAYRACLAQRFSPKALTGILRALERTGAATRDTVAAVIRLVTWQYRWYSEFSPELLATIRSLIEEEGAVKVRSIIQATSLPQNVLDLTHHYAALCATFRGASVEGW